MHRHQGWEGEARDCPICKLEDRVIELEDLLAEAREIIREAVIRLQPLGPFILTKDKQ